MDTDQNNLVTQDDDKNLEIIPPIPEVKPDEKPPEGEAPKEGEQPPEGEKPPIPARKPWFMSALEKERFEKREARRRAEAAEAALEALRLSSGQAPEPKPEKVIPLTEVDTLVQQEVSKREFDRKCNDTFFNGKKEYPDFQEAVTTINAVGIATQAFLDLVTDLPDAHKIIYYLGKNPDEAAALASLTPTKQALELARMETKINNLPQQQQISKTTPPITPIKGGGQSSAQTYVGDDPHKMSDEQYRTWRKKQGM